MRLLGGSLMAVSAFVMLLMVMKCFERSPCAVYQASGRSVTIHELTPLPVEHLLNSGDEKALDAIPGIGTVLAGRMIETRQQEGLYYFPEDVMAVKGIGEKKYQAIMDYIESMSAGSAGE